MKNEAKVLIILHNDDEERGRDISDLPQEAASVLPSELYEQLEVSKKITAMVISSRLSQLEAQTGKLRGKLNEKEEISIEFGESC